MDDRQSARSKGAVEMREAFQKVVGGVLKSFRSVFHADKDEAA
jgi:hypothetical protein